LEALEQELLTFPNGSYDDQVDALSYAAAEVTRAGANWGSPYATTCPGCGLLYTTARQECPNCGVEAPDPQRGITEPYDPALVLANLAKLRADVTRLF
jgi:hypothetical protein